MKFFFLLPMYVPIISGLMFPRIRLDVHCVQLGLELYVE